MRHRLYSTFNFVFCSFSPSCQTNATYKTHKQASLYTTFDATHPQCWRVWWQMLKGHPKFYHLEVTPCSGSHHQHLRSTNAILSSQSSNFPACWAKTVWVRICRFDILQLYRKGCAAGKKNAFTLKIQRFLIKAKFNKMVRYMFIYIYNTNLHIDESRNSKYDILGEQSR